MGGPGCAPGSGIRDGGRAEGIEMGQGWALRGLRQAGPSAGAGGRESLGPASCREPPARAPYGLYGLQGADPSGGCPAGGGSAGTRCCGIRLGHSVVSELTDPRRGESSGRRLLCIETPWVCSRKHGVGHELKARL